jgi:hypothetical protein
MKRFSITGTALLLFVIATSSSRAQNAAENNCFRHFNPTATGQHNVNQYLISLISRLTYPERLGADLRADRRRVPVPDAAFEARFRERTANWFYDPATEPKEPVFNETSWLQLANNCKGDISAADWTMLEDLYYDATQRPRPAKIAAPVLANNRPVSKITDQVVQIPARQTITLDPPTFRKTADGRIVEMRSFSTRGEEIIRKNQANKPDCQRIRENFVAELNRYKIALDQYRAAVISFEAALPRIHYIRTNTLQDPEAVLISTPQYIIVAFRGTDEYLECYPSTSCWPPVKAQTFFANLQIVPIPAIRHRNIPGRVHSGWYASAEKIETQLVQLLNQYNARNKRVWLAGHSKGAGEAIIFGAMLIRQHNIPVQSIYTFGGTSTVGDAAFSNFLNNYFGSNGQARLQRFEVIHDYVASSDLHLLDKTIFPFEPAGKRCFYDNITREGRFFFAKAERTAISKLTDGEAILSLTLNPCQHIIDNYCRSAYYLLERTSGVRANMPAIPAWHGDDAETCTTN